MKNYIIAIDGPSGSGKGTIAKGLADKLNFVHLDSGAIYRCVTLEIINRKIDLKNEDVIVNLFDELEIELKEQGVVLLNGEDVSKRIRENDINAIVSDVAAIGKLRKRIEIFQKEISQNKNIIMEGRDIGTAVFPNADVKFYLDAEIGERARRRYKENIEKEIYCTYEEVLESLKNRDYIDSHREVSPLRKPEDAITVDSTYLTIEQVINKMEEIVINKIGKGIDKCEKNS